MGGASKLLMLLSTPFPFLCPRPSSSSALRLARNSRAALSSLSHPHFPRSTPRIHPNSPVRSQLHTHSAQREAYGDPPLNNSVPASRGFDSPALLWPEWTKLVDNLTAVGYTGDRSSASDGVDDRNSFAVAEGVPEEFARVAEACLAFARDRPDDLRLLSKKNIEVIVDSGSPSLFKNGASSAMRLRLFINDDESNVLASEKAQTVDVMRYVLSYAYTSLSISKGVPNKDAELVEQSVRSLLTEFINISGTVQGSTFTESSPRQAHVSSEQFSRPSSGQNIEMKRGDWNCPKCSFMNFARNARCLECEEVRPKRQLTGGEWECPQCDFFNYGRNMSCIRCDCKRPVEIPSSSPCRKSSSLDQIISGSTIDKSDVEQRLAANDEKAERWFSKVSQLGDKVDMSSAMADEDFPEIMPLRKGVNRFVVSTRKTPLERRLANSQPGVPSGVGSDRPSESAISKSLDRILGRTSTPAAAGEKDTGAGNRFNLSDYKESIAKNDPGYVPFVPLPPDMFSKPQNSNNEVSLEEDPASMKADVPRDSLTGRSTDSVESKNISESSDASATIESKNFSELSDASARWSQSVAEIDNVTGLAGAMPDEDFPEIMPMRKGENRFVVSKKKDRSLTSPQYKRRLAMEQANQSDFVPFVPFPPGYFAKKDKQPEDAPPPNNAASSESSVPPEKVQGVQPEGRTYGHSYNTAPQSESMTYNQSYNAPPQSESMTYNQSYNAPPQSESMTYGQSYNAPPQSESRAYGQSYNKPPQPESRIYNQGYNTAPQPESRAYGHNQNPPPQPDHRSYGLNYNAPPQPRSGSYGQSPYTTSQPGSGTSSRNFPGNNLDESRVGSSNVSSGVSTGGSIQAGEKSQSTGQSWNKVFAGKSLEGSAVTEPDPLDMSEEAKAARWFRRAAQIKNISELSEIPDEDFPEIMPMRKGVNRFVVSKRKTPLERRLTSPQYRRNLPIVRSEPEKDRN